MIPKKSTPIKNDILINIFAKRLLNKEEIGIACYIIRWSWGFDGKNKRQDWTRKMKKRQMAKDIEMDEGNFNKGISNMIKENKVIEKDGCYQFNEHYKSWKNLSNKQVLKTCLINKQNLSNKQAKLVKKTSSTGIKPLQGKPLPERKETLKETYKENICKSRVSEGKKKKKNGNSVRLDFTDGEWYDLGEDMYATWETNFPDLDIDMELKKMKYWLYKHKERAIEIENAHDYPIWIYIWLQKANAKLHNNERTVEQVRAEGVDDFSKAFAKNSFNMEDDYEGNKEPQNER
jgi:hypothetical protein